MMKRYALLVEVLIGLSLTTALLSALVIMTVQLNSLGKTGDVRLKELTESCLTQKRLTQVLSEVILTEEGGLFCSSDPGIVFTYNRGVDPDPQFSADVLGRLYVEDEKLLLATWPNPIRFPEDNPPCKTEVIANNLTSVSFAFYNPPPMENEEDNPPVPYRWQSVWKAEWDTLPRMIRITCNQTLYTITCLHANKPLIFPKKSA